MSTLHPPRRICFVTGTRAEFGLMRSALVAIHAEPRLKLQLIATGMHLDRSRGKSVDAIRESGFEIDAVVPWDEKGNKSSSNQTRAAAATGLAMSSLAGTFEKLGSDIVLVVGDRVEAFAAAAAAHVSGRVVAHVHGGDRAAGIVDDSLRHAITKLAHVHFPATSRSAERIRKLGEQLWRIHRVGSPGLDDMGRAAWWQDLNAEFPALVRRKYALLILHPSSGDEEAERQAAEIVLSATQSAGFQQIVIVYPNNDPGSAGIVRQWEKASAHADGKSLVFIRNLPRLSYLALLREAAMIIGNSSSGIIEAASYGTPVIDIGIRQAGRERGTNVKTVPVHQKKIARAARYIWNKGSPRRRRSRNLYGGGQAGRKIASVLSGLDIDRHVRKLIDW